MEPQARANQVLPQIASLIRIDLGARIIEEVVFHEGAELRSPIVICACNNLPRQVRVTLPPASIERDSTSYGIYDLGPRRFGIVNADARADVRLESLVSRCESQDEVRHKRARIDPSGHVSLRHNVVKGIPQGEVGATPKAVIKEVAFNRWANYTRAKDVTEFDAAKEADVIFWVNFETVSEERRIRIIVRKGSVIAAILVDIGPRVDRAVKAESIHWWWRRGNLLVDLLPGLQ